MSLKNSLPVEMPKPLPEPTECISDGAFEANGGNRPNSRSGSKLMPDLPSEGEFEMTDDAFDPRPVLV